VIEFDQFQAVDMRVGRVTTVDDFRQPRKPAWKLTIDFGPEIGVKRSSAQITHYSRQELEGTLVVAVINFPPRQIGPVSSEVLVLGALDDEQGVVLLRPDRAAEPGRGSADQAAPGVSAQGPGATPMISLPAARSSTATV
jgi:tRNA-binding protein